MAKTKDKVSDAASNVKPYVDRALHDEELRDNVRNAYESARSIYNELIGKRGVTGVATRVATDKDIQDELRSTIAELRKAADRVQGKERAQGPERRPAPARHRARHPVQPVHRPADPRSGCPTASSAAATTSRTRAAAATATAGS